MLIAPRALTNTERQRQFRENNPGYYARLQAKRRASAKRGAAILIQQMQQATAVEEAVRQPLLLLEPAEPSAFMLALDRFVSKAAERELVLVRPFDRTQPLRARLSEAMFRKPESGPLKRALRC